MFSKTKITFFDIPAHTPIPISPNTWKVRLILNFKGLDYETCWVPTADIESVCISMRISPTGNKANGEPHYTLPAIIDYTRSSSNPIILSDSTPIIRYLEHTYPSPSHTLFPIDHEPDYLVFEKLLEKNIMAYASSLWLMDAYNAKLHMDQTHFRERMEHKFGKKLEDIELKGFERDKAWDHLEKGLKEVSGYFPEGKNTKYLMGRQISFPDFALCAHLISIKTISPDGVWKKISGWEKGKWYKFFQNFEEWMSVDGYPASRM